MTTTLRIVFLFFLFQIVYQSLNGQVLSIDRSTFLLDGKPFNMWGVRTASASQKAQYTSKLINALDEYQANGINTISVFIQGSSGGYSDPFSRNGKRIDKQHWKRLTDIIKACQMRDMVVIVGIFYQRTLNAAEIRHIHTEKAIREAVKLVAKKLKPYKNVIINIANEQNSRLYQGFKPYNFNKAEHIIDLCKLVKKVDPNRIVGGGGYNDSLNVIIGKSPYVETLLFDTFSKDIENNQHSGWHYDFFRKQGVPDKPIVNVEIFGGWTRQFLPQGVYHEKGKKIHLQEIAAAKKRPGLYVHFHSNPWFQANAQDLENQFHLGGQGTPDDPGVKWYFEAIKGN